LSLAFCPDIGLHSQENQLGTCVSQSQTVQRRFTKRLPGFHDMEYSARLDKLTNLQSLEYRRLVADLILTYKIIFGLTDIDLNVYFRLKGPENARIRGNPYKIVVNQTECQLNVRKKRFSKRVAVAWNSLPPSVVNFSSLRTFRRTIRGGATGGLWGGGPRAPRRGGFAPPPRRGI